MRRNRILTVATGIAALFLFSLSVSSGVVGSHAVMPALPAVAPGGPPAYPIKASANGRYLVDQNDKPFLLVGDSPQALIGNLSLEDADSYLANRQKYGFNSVWINLLCRDYTGCRPSGTTVDGLQPFVQAGDLATPNETYFARVDQVIGVAAKYGLNVLLDPIETGGWLQFLRNTGKEKAYTYGAYLGKRYRNMPNIIWMSGNDFQSWHDSAADAVVLAVAQGIRDNDPNHLHTLELNYDVSSSLDDVSWASIVGLEAAYTYEPTYAEVLKDYSRPTSHPVFMVEANYEFEHDYTGPATLRRQEYWALLSGATGHLYGNKYTWPFARGWQDHLDTPGSVQVAYATSFFASRRWYDLVPDQQHTFVTAGFGTFVQTGNVNDNDYVAAAVTTDGALAVAYVPTAQTLTVDMGKMNGPVSAQWYDPSSNTYTAVAEGQLDNTGFRDFRTPGKNGGGDSDWVLVLEAPNPSQG